MFDVNKFCILIFNFLFFFRYIIAVCNDHVEAAFPYISDTGSLSPESCIFGELINLGCVLCKFFLKKKGNKSKKQD